MTPRDRLAIAAACLLLTAITAVACLSAGAARAAAVRLREQLELCRCGGGR